MIETKLKWFTPQGKMPEGGSSLLMFVDCELMWVTGYYDGAFEYQAESLESCGVGQEYYWKRLHTKQVKYWAYAPTVDQIKGVSK